MDITLPAARLTAFVGVALGFLAVLMLLMAAAVPAASAEPDTTLPDGGTDLLPPAGLQAMVLTDSTDIGATLTIQSSDHEAFDTLAKLVVPRRPSATWSVQANLPNDVPIAKGDVLYLSFHARCLESMTGEGFADVKFELDRDPWPQSISQQVSYTRQWTQFHFPFVAERDYAPGEAKLSFQLGYDAQVMEMGGIVLKSFGPDFDLEALPRTRLSYAGRELDAPWRREAQERIEQLRMADVSINVVDAAGQPVPDAKVRLAMQRHAFGFGTAVVAQTLAGPKSDAKYAQMVESLFNEVVFENDLKWVSHGFGQPDDMDRAFAWLQERTIGVRGHVLVWPGWSNLPEVLRELADQPEALRQTVADHVTQKASNYAGKLLDWDVLNEPFNNHDLMDILGEEVMDEWFRLARTADPHANLYINDWGILTNGGYDTNHQDTYFRIINDLIHRGAPVQGIGMQGHFGSTLTPPTRLLEIMDRFASTGLRLKITELDIVMIDEELRADYMRDVMTTAFSHPSMDAILLWGFWADRHWKPEAGLWDSGWNIKPHGQAWLDLVHDAWWTDEQGITDADGAFAVRGFLGEYRLVIEHDGQSHKQTFKLGREGGNLAVQLP